MIAFGWLAILAFGIVYTYFGWAKKERNLQKRGGVPLSNSVYAVFSIWLRWTKLYPRLIVHFPQAVRYCHMVYGKENGADPAYCWAVKIFSYTFCGVILTVFAVLLPADPAIVILLSVLTVLCPFLSWRDLMAKVRKRQEAFIAELPTFMHKLSLLIAAGETVQRAWQRAGQSGGERLNHPFYAELWKTGNELTQGIPFTKAMEDLHKRCGVHEMSALVTTVLMNYKRGGDMFALALQDTSRILLERKRALIRSKGEEASTRLLFPMLIMLCSVMLVVAAPAVMMME